MCGGGGWVFFFMIMIFLFSLRPAYGIKTSLPLWLRDRERPGGRGGSVGTATVVKGEEKQLPTCIANTLGLASRQLP